jgi:hypothetical protein
MSRASYHHCKCRDCFEIVCGSVDDQGFALDYCPDCEAADCPDGESADGHHRVECCRDDAYGIADEDGIDGPFNRAIAED